MVELTLLALVWLGLLLRLVLVLAQRAQLRSQPPAAPAVLPGVSILKPVKGLDPDLEENLRSVFRQDYPRFEVIIGARDASDPALVVARRVAAEFPHVPSRVVADSREVGPNPKVANLANMLPYASHPVLLVSDSNVRLHPQTLRDMVAHLEQPGVGLVSSPIRGTGAKSWAGRADALLLNTFVMGGTAAMHRLFSGVCVVGKSMMLRQSTLEELGGFPFLAEFLAEDQVCGQEVAARGLGVELASLPVHNVTGGASLGQVAGRYRRWAMIRRRMAPWGFCGEPLLFPLALASLALAFSPGALTAGVWIAAFFAQLLLSAWALRLVEEKEPWLRLAGLVLVAEHLAVVTWAWAWLSRTVSWRGKGFTLGPRTRLSPREAPMGEAVPSLGQA
ncbi:MAG: ceramide glucosyltransferase [Acidobacteriota bacterium]|jgi:ceramide glucosyltransferase